MKGIAVVPAKGNSERFQGKNLADLCGKPLIHHTLDAIGNAFSCLLVASDAPEILKVAQGHQSVTETFSLPSETTTGKATVLNSMVHMADNNVFDNYDYIGLFLPTCPFRDKTDVENAIELFHGNKDADGVISTTDYEFPPTLGLVKDQDNFIHCYDHRLPWLTGNTRSQDHNEVIRPNGAVYLKHTSMFMLHKNFYKGNIIGYHMPRSRSIDIDTADDLKLAEKLLERKLKL